MKSVFVKMLLLVSLISAAGCAVADPIYYRTSVMNIPNFKEKSEVNLAINAALPTAINVQAAYAFTNHLAIQGSYQTGSEIEQERGGGFFGGRTQEVKRTFSDNEFALGYYTPIFEQSTFSIFGGYSAGKVVNDIKDKGLSSANFNKWFMQSSLGFRDKNVEFIGSIKMGNLKYTNLNQSYTQDEEVKNFEALKNPIPILETGWLMRAGYEDIKIQFQATTTHLLTEPVPKFKFDWLSLSGGICLQLNTKKKVTWKSLWR
jgi:predicted small lipoprotein YifL